MKISDNNPPQGVTHTTKKSTSSQNKVLQLKVENRKDVQPLEEKVNLSTKARDIEKIQEILRKAPDVREDRVAQLKKKITSGEYNVNGKDVADQILREFLLEDLLKT
jgi:negative regulator of flagellin synthesis FlgM